MPKINNKLFNEKNNPNSPQQKILELKNELDLEKSKVKYLEKSQEDQDDLLTDIILGRV